MHSLVYMCKCDMEINVPKPKKKKTEVPRKQQTIAFADNLLEDPDEALDLAAQINLEEHYKQEKERKSKARHATLVLKKDVNKLKEKILIMEMQVTSFKIRAHDKDPRQPQPELQSHSPSVTITSNEDVSRYLNDPPEVQMIELLNEPIYTETTTLTVIPLLDTIHETQEDNFVDKVMESPPATTITITPPIKSNKKREKSLLKKAIHRQDDSRKTIMQSLEEHAQKLNALAQINHAEAIVDSVKANMPKFVSQAVSNFVQPRLERTVLDVIKKNLVNLFHSTSTPSYRGEKKLNKRKGAEGSSSKKGKAQEDTSNFERFEDADEPRQEQEKEYEVQTELVDAYKEPEEHKLQFGSTVMFGKCMKKFLNKDKITKANLKGLAFELQKNMLKNSIELEYNLEQPLQLTGPRGRKSHLQWSCDEGMDNQKMLMRADETHKFSDGTLNKVYNKLDVMMNDNRLGFGNKEMKDREWKKKDKDRIKKKKQDRLQIDCDVSLCVASEIWSIRRIEVSEYGVLEFLGLGTMINIFQSILELAVNTAYVFYWIRRVTLQIFVVSCKVQAQIRCILLDGYNIWVVRTAYF
ncbi:hypothetical protein Tco_0137818 [Tanacetum coccineum]